MSHEVLMARTPRIVSPLSMQLTEGERPAAAADTFLARILWGANPAFGDYLSRAREDANLSLRAAAGRVAISHTYLAQIEQYELRSAPPMELLAKLAKLYGMDEREVQHEAGYRYELPGDIAEELANRDERQFRRLFLHDLFRPEGFTEDDLARFPPAVWRTVVELARKVDANARAGGPDLAPILSPRRGGK
jgi:transcriptional regulator with XRE-family HTH domain